MKLIPARNANLIAAAAIALALLAPHDATASPEIVRQLEAAGGKVTVKDGVATQVEFRECSKLGAAEFKAIGQLTQLKNLTLYNNCQGLTDATLPLLTNLTELETIGTDRIQVTDEALKHFTAFQKLKSASFFHTSFGKAGFTGVGFGHLKALPNLERMTVAGISMGDEGFAAIASITQLKQFSTWHTYQTEAGNAHIAKLPNLQMLKLGQRLPQAGVARPPSLSDVSLPKVASMKTLETLQLGEAQFTVEALKSLKALPKLKQLTLYETDLTTGDVEKLKAELPGVKIDFQPLTAEQKKKFEMYLKQ